MNHELDRVCAGEDLAEREAAHLFARLVTGELSEVEIAALLVALKTKGESPAEIAGAATALREHAAPFRGPEVPYADTCGTGGDGAGTVNISTAVAFVAAEMGIPVAKHGNRSVSSKCGSADVLEMLGVDLDMSTERAERCLRDSGVTYLHAPRYHSGVRHAMPVRRALKTRTIFNVLGPLVNPARPPVQLIGVYDAGLCRPVAETLRLLGLERAVVVHGAGLDEVAVHGPTHCVYLTSGDLVDRELTPADAGVSSHPLAALRGGTPTENTQRFRALLAGDDPGAYRDAVALNAGVLASVFRDQKLTDATAEALEVLRSGRVLARLHRFVEVSRGA